MDLIFKFLPIAKAEIISASSVQLTLPPDFIASIYVVCQQMINFLGPYLTVIIGTFLVLLIVVVIFAALHR